MSDFDSVGAGEFSYVFEDEDTLEDAFGSSDEADDLLFDYYDKVGLEHNELTEAEEVSDREPDGIDAISIGLGMGLGAELAADERNKTEMLRHINEIQTPVDVDENTDRENMKKVRQMTSLRTNSKSKRHKTGFENFLDDIYSGRKSLWDD
ncbi:hypothetical protein DRN34_00065 [Thermococci archaeon]|nr:MAG: hypothetical protein DRN34_00065 [Thermococci archaeon]